MDGVKIYSQEFLDDVARLGTSIVAQATGDDACVVDPAISSLWRGAVFAGQAFPIQCPRGDNLGVHQALSIAPPGSVLVVDAGGDNTAMWGELLTAEARFRRIEAVVIDGASQDLAAIREQHFPVFARGVSLRSAAARASAAVGSPIKLSGTSVAFGDLVVGDDDGLVVVPAAAVVSVVAQARALLDRKLALIDAVSRGKPSVYALGLPSTCGKLAG